MTRRRWIGTPYDTIVSPAAVTRMTELLMPAKARCTSCCRRPDAASSGPPSPVRPKRRFQDDQDRSNSVVSPAGGRSRRWMSPRA